METVPEQKQESLVAVDVGRSGVKVTYASDNGAQLFSFPFLVATKRSATIEGGSVLTSSRNYFWADINGHEYLFGETAQVMGDKVVDLSEGEAFIELNIQTTVFAVAEALRLQGLTNRKVMLAINLTFQNNHLKDRFHQELKRHHTVVFKLTNTRVDFDIDIVSVLYQGYSGALSIIMGSDLQALPQYSKSSGVVVDVGRHTIDMVQIEQIHPKDGASYDYGTFLIFNRVSQVLRKTHNVVKDTWELEKSYLANKPIPTMSGASIDLAPIVAQEVAEVFPDVNRVFSTFIGHKTPDYVFLIGGGAHLYARYFQEKYPIIKTPENPQFANAIGMLRFLSRVRASHKG